MLSLFSRVSSIASPSIVSLRYFSASPSVWAKKDKKGSSKKDNGKKSSSNAPVEDDEVEILDPKKILTEVKQQCDESFKLYSKSLTELKMGKANPSLFDNLKIKIDDSYTATFPEIAMSAMKGTGFLNINVFDPAHSKKVISAILEANMNLNPELDPKNPQLLKIKLPNSTKELREKQIKDMKALLDQYKSNTSFKNSLPFIRSNVLKNLKKVDGSKDIIKKLTTDIDATYKSYVEKFTNSFKTTEKSLN